MIRINKIKCVTTNFIVTMANNAATTGKEVYYYYFIIIIGTVLKVRRS